MNESEFVECLASAEHESWSRWMSYLFSRCETLSNGTMMIPPELVRRWLRQAQMPYAELSEREKQSDREEVTHILPIIRQFVKGEEHGIPGTT